MSDASSSGLSLARHYMDIDRPQSALDVLAEVSNGNVETPDYWAIRAQALLDLDRPDEGAKAARRGLELDPEDIELLDSLALCELAWNRFGRAEAALRTALELEPGHPILLSHYALVLARDERFDEARAAVAQALAAAPESPSVLRVRAQVAMLAKDPNAAVYVDLLLRADPEDRIGHALRGNIAVQQKRFAAASSAFDEAARLNPGDREVAIVAREARVAAHPLLAPVRSMNRLGRWRTRLLYVTLLLAAGAVGVPGLRVAVVAAWLVLLGLSWFGPRILRWRQRRKYGAF